VQWIVPHLFELWIDDKLEAAWHLQTLESPLANIDWPQHEQPASLAQQPPVERSFFSTVFMLVAGFNLGKIVA
jgi:hypothetical protein